MDRNEAQQKLAEELVATKREAKYGHPKDNYRRIAHIWSAVLGIEVTPTQAVLCELGVKFSRLIQSPDDEDTQVDIHGYVKVLQRLLDPKDQPAGGETEVKVKWKKMTEKPYEVYIPEWEPGPYELKPEDAPVITFADGLKDTYIRGSNGSKIKVYQDGSKDMTFEEAVGPRRNPCGQ